ncbi:MAG: hypothetical protein U5K77_02580 [Candidatus Saccharibacteria bacterium]|nr:hypothetical protein [Candidatus Saccharibacteria bacterium]
MSAYILLIAMLVAPLLLGVFSRVATPHLFLSLLAGELLERYFKEDAELALSTVVRNESVLQWLGFAILVIPMVLTAIFLRRTIGKNKTLLHMLPLVITGVVFAAFALPLLPESVQAQVTSTHYGNMLNDSINFIVGVMIFLQLVALWLFNRGSDKHGKKK